MKGNIMTRKLYGGIVLAAVAAMIMTGCGNTDVSGGGDNGGKTAGGGSIAQYYDLSGASVTVGSKEFTESKILGQITIAALQAAGAKVSDKTGISGTDTVRAALESGEIDMYWEYTGTGWVNILGHTTKNLPKDLYTAVADEDKTNDVVWLPPAPFNDTYRIAAAADFAKKNNLTTMSDMAKYIKANPKEGTLCAASEFLNRDDGLPGLEKAYDFKFGTVKELDLNLIYPQVGKGCNFGEVFSTDARIVSNDLTVLQDDKKFFVEYNGALTVRKKVMDKYPDIAKIMNPISKLLTDDVITGLNSQVDNDGKREAVVAKAFLKKNGFID